MRTATLVVSGTHSGGTVKFSGLYPRGSSPLIMGEVDGPQKRPKHALYVEGQKKKKKRNSIKIIQSSGDDIHDDASRNSAKGSQRPSKLFEKRVFLLRNINIGFSIFMEIFITRQGELHKVYQRSLILRKFWSRSMFIWVDIKEVL